jgi:hypothetical protein
MAGGGLHSGLFHPAIVVDIGLVLASASGLESGVRLGLGYWGTLLVPLHRTGMELLLLRQLVESLVVVHGVVVFPQLLLAARLECRSRCWLVVQRMVGLARRILPLVVLSTWVLESPLAALLLVESK